MLVYRFTGIPADKSNPRCPFVRTVKRYHFMVRVPHMLPDEKTRAQSPITCPRPYKGCQVFTGDVFYIPNTPYPIGASSHHIHKPSLSSLATSAKFQRNTYLRRLRNTVRYACLPFTHEIAQIFSTIVYRSRSIYRITVHAYWPLDKGR